MRIIQLRVNQLQFIQSAESWLAKSQSAESWLAKNQSAEIMSAETLPKIRVFFEVTQNQLI
jgi:hypothetical protein